MDSIIDLIRNNQVLLIVAGVMLVALAWFKDVLNLGKKLWAAIPSWVNPEDKPVVVPKPERKEKMKADLAVIMTKMEELVGILDDGNLKDSSVLLRNVMVDVVKEYVAKEK